MRSLKLALAAAVALVMTAGTAAADEQTSQPSQTDAPTYMPLRVIVSEAGGWKQNGPFEQMDSQNTLIPMRHAQLDIEGTLAVSKADDVNFRLGEMAVTATMVIQRYNKTKHAWMSDAPHASIGISYVSNGRYHFEIYCFGVDPSDIMAILDFTAPSASDEKIVLEALNKLLQHTLVF